MTQKLYEVLNWASLFLEQHNREVRVAELLLQHHLNISRTQFYAQMREEIPENIVERFRADVEKHAKTGIPIQHLTGYEIFYGRKFLVNNHVLIPRPETEELVLHVVNQAPKDEPITIVDIGTGSGIIAITLALELANATVYAIDISENALDVARKNADVLQADVTFLHGNFLEPLVNLELKADIVVSNPPYISEGEREQLSDTVINHDPELALFADDNGLAAYKQITKMLPVSVKRGGVVAFEIGHLQGKTVMSLIQETFPNASVKVIQDINGKNRIVFANNL